MQSNRRVMMALLVLSCALFGCANQARMTNMWNDTAFTQRPLHDVLVVAVRKDAARRRVWEDAFVADLKARGVAATASYTMFNDVPDTDQVIAAVRDRNFGAVVASARLQSGEESQVVPGYVTKQADLRYNPWTNRYHTYFKDVVVPGYVETTKIHRVRTDVWSGGQLVWTGTLNVTGAPDPSLVQNNVSGKIDAEMAKIGLVSKRP
jgi:hypothetical protein